MKFLQRLEKRMQSVNSVLCVGLDPVIEKLPTHFKTTTDPFFEFGKWIIEQTHQYVCSYKPNSAFYESQGAEGILSLKKTCDYLKETHPDIPIIIDAKRGDIGHTNKQSALFIFEYLGADAVTLHPYIGSEALQEFFEYAEKGLIVLCKTSNPEAGEFQDLLVEGIPLWKKIAIEVTTKWQKKSKADILLVIGATYPTELQEVRVIAPLTTFLVPGIGIQGGDLKKILLSGRKADGLGLIINSSREVLYSKSPKNTVRQIWENSIKFN